MSRREQYLEALGARRCGAARTSAPLPSASCRDRACGGRSASPSSERVDRALGRRCGQRSASARAASCAGRAPRPCSASAIARAELLVIGEAPGADEDRQGEPFVGRAGQLLNSMLRAMGNPRESVYIANVLKCRPPGNRDPSPSEVAACLPYLQRQIELLRPRLILAVGPHRGAESAGDRYARSGGCAASVHRFGARCHAADRHLSSGLSAAQSRREAQGLDRSEVRARRARARPRLRLDGALAWLEATVGEPSWPS